MEGLFWFVVGLAVTLILMYFSGGWETFKQRISTFSRRIKEGKKPDVKIGPMVLTGVQQARLKPTIVGAMVLPITRFLGGDGQTQYKYPDGIVSSWNAETLTLPPDMMEISGKLVEERRSAAIARGAIFENRAHVRLDDFVFGLQGLHDELWPLKLSVSTTDYNTIQATNYSIDEVLPGGETIRERYAEDPGDLRSSVLGNPIATNLSVVTSDRRIFVAVRGKKTATTPSGFAPAVSGTGNPHLDLDENKQYNPFLTAQRETAEEITGIPPRLDEIRFFGLARTLKFQLPFLFGEVRLTATSSQQLESSVPRDAWEAEQIVSIALDPDAILRFVREVYKETDENSIVNSATYAALFSLLQSLLYEYPNDWINIVKELETLPKRTTSTHTAMFRKKTTAK
jgi:hypothetical protein